MKYKSNVLHGLQQQVAESIAGHNQLLLALCGGLDSTVLLEILKSLRDANNQKTGPQLSLRAMHVHHGLSTHADLWVTHCEQQCRQRTVPFKVIRVKLETIPTPKNGIEAAARNARYQALHDVLVPGEVLLTAQHQDDQAETLLLALKRGSGPAGLAAMAANSSLGDHRLLRPLLACSRAQLAAYAVALNLSWIEDDSNQNDRFDRNFLRLRILMPLQQRWPKFSQAATRSAQLCGEQETLLDELLKETLTTLVRSDGGLQLTPLLPMSHLRRGALLRRWLASQGAEMPSRQQLAHLWQEVALSRRDAVPQFAIGNKLLRRFRDRLYLLSTPISAEPKVDALLWPVSTAQLLLPHHLGLLIRQLNDTVISPNINIVNTSVSVIRAPQSDEGVSVRFGKVDGLLHIVGHRHGRTLKKIWQKLAVPPWQRRRTPLLFYNQRLIAAPGIFVTRDGEVQNNCAQWRLHWLPSSSLDFPVNFIPGS
ncbi:tRNA lysidine(34) synthetase TilS [Candidatus Palibaumannia cicadellinicola]|uniref:tRNA(Ile)-lysidine synthase n=1 Tax=Candidatus Palibaumannia cicadellinicola TaxID=186490 RepID=A0A2N4XWD5_9GAMM|nr:tRNA lysidine(34) synthetase TilS [Candidatus Baumannia cicadellinicola]PLK58308.1 tRNA lysidine(34) synthetase TilS [Candidatus Baumannia cicadellinicola]